MHETNALGNDRGATTKGLVSANIEVEEKCGRISTPRVASINPPLISSETPAIREMLPEAVKHNSGYLITLGIND